MGAGHGCPGKALMPVRRIVEQATRIFALGPNEICGPRRPSYVTMARNAVYLVAYEAGWSSVRIGGIVGRDHSTVLHGRDVARRDIKRSAEYAARVQELREFAAGPIYTPYRPLPAQVVKLSPPKPKSAPRTKYEPPTSGEKDQDMRRAGTIALLAALRREHPERCLAA
jgi:hypothetical protein